MKNNKLKISSWNSCLGLFKKLDFIRTLLIDTVPDILFIQEVELNKDMDMEHFRVAGYTFYSSTPTVYKTRIAAYIKSDLNCEVKT